MPVLSKEDRAFWEGNGYVVVHNAVPQENLDAMVTTIWEFLEMDPECAEDWYKYQPYTRDNLCSPISAAGMVEIYQHQALWDNRQYPKVHQAFAEIWGDEKLWVSLDRANMKPPAREDRPEWCNKGMIHWDVDTTQQPVSFGVQGVMYLTDTTEDQGGFQCVPGFHRIFDEWVKTQPADRDTRRPDLQGLTVKSIAGPSWRPADLASVVGPTAMATINLIGRDWRSTSPCRQHPPTESPHARSGSRLGRSGDRRLAGPAMRGIGNTSISSLPS